jgi:WD40 repeat protein
MDMETEAQFKPKTQVFISYSRKDAAFADALQAALLRRGYEAFLDRTDIAPGEDWRARLNGLILAADAVVYVLTDNALGSEICGWEIARTVELGKRLIPLAHGPRSLPVPDALAALNYVFSDAPGMGSIVPDEPSSLALDNLGRALDADIAWVREHARLTARAAEWEKAPDDAKDAKLLRRGEVEVARAWIGLRPGPAAPAIPDLLLTFLDKSEAHEREQRDRQRRTIGRAFVKPIEQAVQECRHDAALRLAAAGAVLAEDPDFDLVPELWKASASAVLANRAHVFLKGHTNGVCDASFSPDGVQLVSAAHDGSARVWNLRTGSCRVLKGHRGGVLRAMFFSNGRRVLTTSMDATARCWDVETGEVTVSLEGHRDYVMDAKLTPDGLQVVTASQDGTVRLWDLSDGREVHAWQSGPALDCTFDLSTDGTFVAFVTSEGASVCVAATGEVVWRQLLPPESDRGVDCIAFSADGRTLATGRSDGQILLRNLTTGEQAALGVEPGPVASLVFCPIGKRLLSRTGRGDKRSSTASLWSLENMERAATLEGHRGGIRSAVFSPDGARVVSASSDKIAKVWDAHDGKEIVALHGHLNPLTTAIFAPDGQQVVTGSTDGSLRVWDCMRSSALAALPNSSRSMFINRSNDRDPRIVTIGSDRVVQIIDVESLQISDLASADASVMDVSITARGVSIAEHEWAEIRLNDLVTNTCHTLVGHTHGLGSVKFNCAGSRLFTAAQNYSTDTSFRVWDVATGTAVAELDTGGCHVNELAFTRNGLLVAAVVSDGSVRVWSETNLSLFAVLRPAGAELRSVDFSPDGALLVTACTDDRVRLWSVASQEELAWCAFPSPKWAKFTGNGRFVAIGQRLFPDGRIATGVKLWDLSNPESGIELADVGTPTRAVALDQAGWTVALETVSLETDAAQAKVWHTGSGVEVLRLEGSIVAHMPHFGRLVTLGSNSGSQVLDARRLKALHLKPGELVAAALAFGVGRRLEEEARDLLMQDAPDDLHSALLDLHHADRRDAIEQAATQLREPMHPHCYLSPTQFAEKFGLKLEPAAPVAKTDADGHGEPKPSRAGEDVLEEGTVPKRANWDIEHAIPDNPPVKPASTLAGPPAYGKPRLGLDPLAIALFGLAMLALGAAGAFVLTDLGILPRE